MTGVAFDVIEIGRARLCKKFKKKRYIVRQNFTSFLNCYRMDSTDGLFSHSSTTYHVERQGSGFLIKRMQTNGAVVAQLFETEGVSHFSWVNITSVLVNQKSSSGDISGGSITTDSLTFSFEDSDYKWNADRDLKAREPFFSSGEYFSDNQGETKEALKKGLVLQKQILNNLDSSAEAVQKSHQVWHFG